MSVHATRGGVLAGVVAAMAGASVLATGVLVLRPSMPSAPAIRPAEPQEIGAILHLLDLTPERLAAAGVSALQCDGLFDAGNAYCIQADRTHEFAVAFKALNQAQARAAKPPVAGDQQLPTVAQAGTNLDNIKRAAFTFLTTGLPPQTVSKLSRIRANAHWSIDAPYLVVDRTDQQWLALRGALAAKRYSVRSGQHMPAAAAQVLAQADGDPAVALAKADLLGGLAGVRQAWMSHERPAP
ncbi:MAG TPA: hypothetical protein PKE29_18030 [Phycisphaerales bacterium]|nr:hypothetical protein [Phycisphaerales bacterium]